MPTMLRTSKKAKKIAVSLLGIPVTHETKKALKKEKRLNRQLMREDYRMAR